MSATETKTVKTEDHQPAFVIDPEIGYIIACTCGEKPKKRSQRISMMHVWHMSHLRKLELPRIDRYVGEWPRTGR